MYIKPLVEVHQEFNIVPAGITDPLRAFLVGPHFQLAKTRAAGLLGAYDSAEDTCFTWPGRAAGAVVDEAYTRLFIDDAQLQYFNSASVVGAACEATYCDGTVGGYKNRIRSAVINWKANGSSFPRNALLYQRDVAVGDLIKVTGVVDGAVVEHQTYVAGFIYEQVASAILGDTEDVGNQADDTQSVTFAQTAGESNGVFIDSASAAGYDGLADGDVVETYTLEVIQAGDPADPENLPLFRVTSASGHDDVAAVTAPEFGTSMAVGTRGLTVTFQTGGSSSSSSESGAPVGFILGQTWEVTVSMNFNANVVTAAGTYTGPEDTTYIVEVSRGGTWNDGPQIMVSTTTGIDTSGPHTLEALNPADESLGSAAEAIGAYGITVAFDESGLCAGDRFYVQVRAVADGAARTLVLGRNLPDGLAGLSGGVCGAVPALTVTLYMKKNIEVPRNRVGYAPLTNFDTEATQVCVNSGILAYDSTWTDALGELLPMPVKGGTLWVQYRAYLPTYATAAGSVSSPSDVAARLGDIDVDNPLAYGVYKAVSASNGTPVIFASVMGQSLTDWAAPLALAELRDDVYGLVPLSFDRAVHDLFAGHCASMSGPEVGRWRKAFVSGYVGTESALLTDAGGSPILATVTDDPNAAGTQYTLVQLDAGSAASVSFSGVRAGDVLRAEYRSDGFGTMTYSEYVVDAVLSDDSLRLLTGPGSAINVASKIEVWRRLTAEDKVAKVVAYSGSFGSRRAHNVVPDYVTSGGVAVPGYYLCATIAGTLSGVVPHQGLTHLELVGYSGVPQVTQVFTEDQLDRMAAAGAWIVTQDAGTGTIYSRHAVTTSVVDVNQSEEVITRNVDSISYQCLRALEPYIGRTNITEDNIDQIGAELESVLGYLSSSSSTRSLGPQLISYELVSLAQHPVLRDRLVAVVNLVLPYPLNNLELHLVV